MKRVTLFKIKLSKHIDGQGGGHEVIKWDTARPVNLVVIVEAVAGRVHYNLRDAHGSLGGGGGDIEQGESVVLSLNYGLVLAVDAPGGNATALVSALG